MEAAVSETKMAATIVRPRRFDRTLVAGFVNLVLLLTMGYSVSFDFTQLRFYADAAAGAPWLPGSI